MFKYSKDIHEVKIFCPNCDRNLKFRIPQEELEKTRELYPFTFRYIHGQPPHSVTLYIDKKHDIRGQEFGDSIKLSNEIISNIFNSRKNQIEHNPGIVMKSVLNTFSTIINSYVPESEELNYKIGTKLGQEFKDFFRPKELPEIVEDLRRFWKKNGFGDLEEVAINDGTVQFSVYDCFECAYMPNIQRRVCKLDEGFLTSIMEGLYKKKYKVTELECYAEGKDRCTFEIKEMGKNII